MTPTFTHHLFLSYARTPDALVAREVERLLESFHDTLRQTRDQSAEGLPPLTICLDGSDFSMPPPDERAALEANGGDVLDVVFRHMATCRELLVLCSTGAARSAWIDREIRWFLEHRGPEHIRVAVTEGDAPWKEPERYYPPALLERGLQSRIFYDLRGYDQRRARDWTQVPEFQREMVRLAADLHGQPAGELYPTWLENELGRARAQSLSLVGTSRFETLTGDPGRALLVAFEAHELHPSPDTETALRDAYRVTILHHENRREAAMMTGSGPRYLAGRWKQGAVFSKSSPDGRYHVMVTERGKDGPSPPGDVFLINNETMRVAKLVAPEGQYARVEDVAFDRESQRVLVSRYFHVHVYDLLGRLTGSYFAQRHTKSPVHAVAGMLGKYVLAAETKGGLWLVEPAGWGGEYREVTPEFYNDATVAIEISPNGDCAAVVRESGRAEIVRLSSSGDVERAAIPGSGIQYAGFPLRSASVIATASADGRVRTFQGTDLDPTALVESAALGASLDWVSGTPDGRRLLAVGDRDALFVLDADTGELLQPLEFAADIDWKRVRSRPLADRAVSTRPAEPLGPPEPLDAAALTVANVVRLHDEPWLLVEDYRENEYWPKRTAWRVEGEVAVPWSEWFQTVEARGPFLWLGNGNCFVVERGRLTRVPGETAFLEQLMVEEGRGWFATRQGLYLHDGEQCRFLGPEGTWFHTVARVGASLWAWGQETGAHLIESDAGRAIPMAEPFGEVTRIVEVNGTTWILLKDKPVYRVSSGRARPWRDVPIKDVVSPGGHTWLVAAPALYRLKGDHADEVGGFAAPVSRAVPVGRRLLVLTDTSAPFMAGNAGPAYLVDAETLVVEQVGDFPSAVVGVCGGRVLVGPQTVFVWTLSGTAPIRQRYAMIAADGLRWMDFGHGDVRFSTLGEEGFVLTDSGAYRLDDRGPTKIEGIEGAVLDATVVAGDTWLLGRDGFWRLGARAVDRYSTGPDTPVRIVPAGGRLWVVTERHQSPGALYRIDGTECVPVREASEGISSVAEINGTLWALRRLVGKPAPMIRL